MLIEITSFGHKYGQPEADVMLDMRCLENPYWVPGLRELSGLDAPVREYILRDKDSAAYLQNVLTLMAMQAKLAADGCRDLYQFWGDSLAAALAKETDTIVDLASWEYGQCVARHLPAGVRRIICVFGELKGGKVVEKGTLCKMARGEMVRYMAEHRVEDPAELRNFDRLSYVFSPEHSDECVYVFLKEAADR